MNQEFLESKKELIRWSNSTLEDIHSFLKELKKGLDSDNPEKQMTCATAIKVIDSFLRNNLEENIAHVMEHVLTLFREEKSKT